MADFNEKFPEAAPQSIHGNMLKAADEASCTWCKKPTTWIEVNYEARVCSEECVKAMDDDAASYAWRG